MQTLSWLLTAALALQGADALAIRSDDTAILEGGLERRQNNNANPRVLLAQNVQSASAKTGQAGNPTPGQVNSQTDPANFINFCSGKTLTNGLQVRTGSCNGVVMGEIPATTNMISTLLLFPNPESNLVENQNFNISVRTDNLIAGSFTNAVNTYYSAPQRLDRQSGQVIGHTHVTVQLIDDASGKPPKANTFAFFKGINTPADNNGILSAIVTGGLPAGKYRVCTMTSSSNHQPVLMPVAQRGAQDDCQRFTVRKGQGNGNNGNNGNNGRTGQTPPANGNNGRTGAGNGNNRAGAGGNGNARTGAGNGGTRTGGRQGQGQGRTGRAGAKDVPSTTTEVSEESAPTLPPVVDTPPTGNSTSGNSTVVRRFKIPVPEPLYED
ncbi:hypothetical protein ABW21_db0204423 [Orbilia brochopaga]|nr:hypothetical protein ABW21_db0204423 [Drechslerella brochopaga]